MTEKDMSTAQMAFILGETVVELRLLQKRVEKLESNLEGIHRIVSANTLMGVENASRMEKLVKEKEP